MSIKTRLTKLEQTINKGDELIINVTIIEDDGTVISCSQRQDNCPELPCKKNPCLYSVPGDWTINVRSGDNDDQD